MNILLLCYNHIDHLKSLKIIILKLVNLLKTIKPKISLVTCFFLVTDIINIIIINKKLKQKLKHYYNLTKIFI